MRYTFQALRSSLRDKIGSLSLWVLSIVSAMPSYGYAQFKSRVSLGLAGDAYMTRDNVNNGQAHGALLIENKGDGREIFIDIGAGGLIGESSHTYIKALTSSADSLKLDINTGDTGADAFVEFNPYISREGGL